MFLVRKMNQIRRILLFGCFFSTIFNIKAYDFEHEKIYYKITSESKATVGVDGGATEYIGKIVIPEEVQGGDGIFIVGPGGEIVGPPVVDYSKTYRVTSIEENAFGGCLGVETVTLPESIVSVNKCAFQNCLFLVQIYCLGQVPPVCDSSSFDNVNKKDCVLYVPKGRLAAYRNAHVWKDFPMIVESDFSGIVEIQNSVRISGKEDRIIIDGITEGYVWIYDINGVLVKTLPATGERMEIRLQERGIYLVNTAIQRLKISGLERRTRWLDEDSNSSKKEEGELK